MVRPKRAVGTFLIRAYWSEPSCAMTDRVPSPPFELKRRLRFKS